MRRLFLPLQAVQPGRELWLLVPELRVALVPFLADCPRHRSCAGTAWLAAGCPGAQGPSLCAWGMAPREPGSCSWGAPVPGHGHTLAQTLQGQFAVFGVTARHREDGKQGGGISVIHHRPFIMPEGLKVQLR